MLIDNILSNISDSETISGSILTQVTDHFPQFLILKQAGVCYKTLQYYQHDFSRFNAGDLLSTFKNLDLAFLKDKSLDVDAKFNRFLSILDELVKTHAPLIKLSRRDIKFRNKPWISGKIQEMMRLIDRLLRNLAKSNDQSHKDLYKNLGIESQNPREKVKPTISTTFSRNIAIT